MDPSTESTESPSDFRNFYQAWITRLEHYLHELLNHLRFPEQQDELKRQLIHEVMNHYHEYFLAKAQVSRRDVFLVLSPPWCTSYERTFLWLAGFKPTLTIYVVKRCGIEFTTDQAERLERLVEEVKNEETEITERLARLEQQMVSPRMLALARMGGREVNGMMNDADIVMDRLAEDMKLLVTCADYLREKTVGNVVVMLTTAQTLRFLAGIVQLQLRIRRWGLIWDGQTGTNADTSVPQ